MEMWNLKKGYKIINEYFIEPMLKKNDRHIGMELEYPLIMNENTNAKSLVMKMFDYLIESFGFKEEKKDINGNVIRIESKEGDRISADYHYEIIEFAMNKSLCINDIEKRFIMYFNSVQEFLKKYGAFLTGMGTNLRKKSPDFIYTKDAYCDAFNGYITQYLNKRLQDAYICSMQSVQTHLDIDGNELLEQFNLFTKLDFVRGILFSNSLPNNNLFPEGVKCDDKTLCVRDFYWQNSGIPNTELIDCEFKSLEELTEYFSNKKIFIERNKNKLYPIEAISINDYFEKDDSIEESIKSCRFFENVVINLHHTLEFRGDCIQPLKDTFAPSAFNLGISANIKKADIITKEFFKKNNIILKNSELRKYAVLDKKIVDDDIMREFLYKLYDISNEGLVNRGYGEEKYIECLKERIASLQCPAKKQKLLIESGTKSVDEIILDCSKF